MNRKTRPFTCYFCNKEITDETEVGHISVCGNVLVPCPNKCGSYVPRMDLHVHKKECPNRIGRSMTRLTSSTTDFVEINDGNVPSTTATLDRKFNNNTLPSRSSHDLRDSFYILQNDIQKLSSRLSSYEQRNFNNSSNTTSSQQIDSLKNYQLQLRMELEKFKYESQLINEWKKAIEFKLETVKASVTSCEKFRSETEIHWRNFQQELMVLKQLQMDLELLRNSYSKEQNYNRQADLEFAKKLDEFKDVFDQENATIAALWNDHKILIDNIQQDINEIKLIVEESKVKHSGVVFDVKSVTQTASEAAERVEIQERELREIKKQVEQLRLDFEILENLAAEDSGSGSASSLPGHIIWRISEFESKMAKAKENENVIKSQIFYTHEFGYKIRIYVYLNGLKKWKDRYALISIHVLRGDYDALLKWPCHIEGMVTLRDLEDTENPKHFSKYISAKRQQGDEENEEPQESSASYIFIPHTTLTKSKYLKNNTIYLEIKISQNRKLTETTL